MQAYYIPNIRKGLLQFPSLVNEVCMLVVIICVSLCNRNGCDTIWHLFSYIRWSELCYVCLNNCSMLVQYDKHFLQAMKGHYAHICCTLCWWQTRRGSGGGPDLCVLG